MTTETASLDTEALVRSTAIFRELSSEQLAAIWSQAKLVSLLRGDTLVKQNAVSDVMYIVASGRFEVWVEGEPRPINEIGVGEPIGEIGFFSGAPRTATIVAARDSMVLALDRMCFDSVAREVPAIYHTVLQALARRLADGGARGASRRQVGVARTIAIVAGGDTPVPEIFFDRLAKVVTADGRGIVLTYGDVQRQVPHRALDDERVSNWLNAIENEYELIAYRTEATLTDWTCKAIRQADQVIVVTSGPEPEKINQVETFAFATHPPARRRLIRLHGQRSGSVKDTAGWLREREAAMHHQVALADDLDFRSLHRFLTGRALGYVAAGGGGFGPAHIGVYKAFSERGVMFDILGGASIGAAVLGGFALLKSPEEVDFAAHDVFVTSKGFKHFTLPRYALLDHINFDDALRRQFKGVNVEDAWRPYFAVATLLDGSGQGPHLMRHGPFWKAVRASGSLPAVLPPVFTDDGRMLVDGGVVENVPLRSMKSLKSGPNLVVHFGVRESQRFDVDYASIPGRWQLLRQMMTASGRKKLPSLPSPVGMLHRCLVMNQNPDLLPVGPLDLVLCVPPLPGANFMDFDRHLEVFEEAYRWCSKLLDELDKSDSPALAAILASRE